MSVLTDSALKEVSRLREEIKKVDKVIAPHLQSKRQFEEQLAALQSYLRAAGEKFDEGEQSSLSIEVYDVVGLKKRALTQVAYETLKRIGHKTHLKDLATEIEKDGKYKIPGKNPLRNLQAVLWRDGKRVIHHGRQIYGLKEWEQSLK